MAEVPGKPGLAPMPPQSNPSYRQIALSNSSLFGAAGPGRRFRARIGSAAAL